MGDKTSLYHVLLKCYFTLQVELSETTTMAMKVVLHILVCVALVAWVFAANAPDTCSDDSFTRYTHKSLNSSCTWYMWCSASNKGQAPYENYCRRGKYFNQTSATCVYADACPNLQLRKHARLIHATHT